MYDMLACQYMTLGPVASYNDIYNKQQAGYIGMLKDKTLTYISLFSCAGVGCFGFKKAGFACIATNELIERRLKVQRYNQKCRFDSGYICEDITADSAKDKIFTEIERWKALGNDRVDVLIATPPCQGMSVANHKKTDDEIVRNSLVVESIQLIQKIAPRFFIFENVPAFMKTGCTAPDGTVKAIGDVIYEELGGKYIIADRILNFKNYGSNSSRTRTVVIGVSQEMAEYVSPIELYPAYKKECTLRTVIGDMPKLSWGEICETDFYHAFRVYPEEMRAWVHGLKEGESAFDNEDERRRPHKIVDGKIVPNIRKNGDKYTRQYWDRTAPCIHTRNDQLASQNTVHPAEDRVFSIHELMRIMTIPDDFRWVEASLEELNGLAEQEKRALLKKEEIKIRQSIGEAVPTEIFFRMACRIKSFMEREHITNAAIGRTIEERGLADAERLISFITDNPLNLGEASLARIAELANTKRENNAAYYTNKFIINEIFKRLPEFEKDELHILEPSVGVGNFLPFVFKKYESVKKLCIDVVDIDEKNLKILELLLKKQGIPENVRLNYICGDTLLYPFREKYDLVIGNPPFSKLKAKDAARYLKNNRNQDTTNTFEFFLEKAMSIAGYVVMITPKALLNTPEFLATRALLALKKIDCIQDYGEKGFKGVLVETICLFIDTKGRPNHTRVESITLKKRMVQKQKYIMDKAFPYWIIYRDEFFDKVSRKLDFGRFSVFRDRQITNSNTMPEKDGDCLRVLKSRNISDNGRELIAISGYDSYIKTDAAKELHAYKYVGDESVYLTPNMTYKPRVMRNKGNVIVNGSVAVLIPKKPVELNEGQLAYFSSEEYRKFYQIARNYQTRSLNVDAASVFFYGVLREDAMKNQTIYDFLDEHDYDVRKTHNGRWIDQKCTMDVLCLVSDCIIEYTERKKCTAFTVKDIWYSDYTVDNVRDIFSKPDPAKKATHEYDKYFGQPIKLLDAAGIIRGERKGRGYKYHIVNQGLLEYLSFRERNCYTFLCLYIEKVLRDSGIYEAFEDFFRQQNKESFRKLKKAFTDFTIKNTPINGVTECGRIFTKVLNPLACKYKKKGTEKGYLSRDIITQDKIMYNQRNWRDVLSAKPKEVTRDEYEETLPKADADKMTVYCINRAKKNLRRFNDRYRDGKSELYDKRHMLDFATQMHHIFPASEFPAIADSAENLIALTPTQHYSYAHPNNQTQYIDKEYQYLCLRAKLESIRDNLLGEKKEPVFYDFSSFQRVLNTGLGTEEFSEVSDMDFDGLLERLGKYYQ